MSLTVCHIEDRLAYATIRQDFDWRNVIFFSTRQLSLVELRSSSRVSYWWPPIRWTLHGKTSRRLCRLSVACWGWMSYDWAETLERIHGWFTEDTQEQILTNVMIPSAWELYPEGTLHFQQGNHPVYIANRIQEWFIWRPDIDLLVWPPNSPDMNPIENVWARVKRILRSNWAEPPVRI